MNIKWTTFSFLNRLLFKWWQSAFDKIFEAVQRRITEKFTNGYDKKFCYFKIVRIVGGHGEERLVWLKYKYWLKFVDWYNQR